MGHSSSGGERNKRWSATGTGVGSKRVSTYGELGRAIEENAARKSEDKVCLVVALSGKERGGLLDLLFLGDGFFLGHVEKKVF